ncbi:MFS transporter [Enemella evansiae]|uniref:MFS transporter n=1 Tax=Enemella evansiae TaxID=2016499 RepID=UPI000B97830C|nr:MFS transporter [Enemella evansiae]OYO06446.1 MFS transporter [Enemella evansiae]
MTTDNMPVSPAGAPERQRITPGARRAIFASTLGTVIEWYDYALYGVAAGLVISPLFFPGQVAGRGLLLALATFAVGFLIRPLGGLMIAHIGNRYGRRPAMLLTILLMGVATVGMGLLPTAATIGVWAPILLVVLRALQGFGAGAELSGALTVAAEYTPEHRRGFFTSIINMSSGIGSALAMLAFLAVSALPQEVLLGGAWRIPFLLSGVLFLLALYIRKRLEETPEYVAAQQKHESEVEQSAPVAEVFRADPKRAVLAILLWSGHNANTYVVITFALGYLTTTVGMDRPTALVITVTAALLGGAATPIWGLVADRIGYKRQYLGIMVFGVVAVVPYFWMLSTGNVVLVSIGMFIASCLIWGATQASAGAVTTNLFPVEYRFSGVAVAKEINAAAVAGPTPLIAAALVAAAGGRPYTAAIFIGACFVVTIVSLLALGKRVGDVPAESLT